MMSERAEMIGKKFGKLMPVEVVGTKRIHLIYRCVCECGNEVEVLGNSLRSGNTKSCGCIRRPNLVGMENDHGVVISKVRNQMWEISCKHCGDTHVQNQRELRRNSHPMSCSAYKPPNWSGFEREDNIIRKQYGISMQQFTKLLASQGGGCAICKKPMETIRRRMNIDHCHETNEVRGILCSGCNTGLGHLGDNVAGLQRAIAYLQNPPFKLSLAR
jgi:hypothetical protein